MQKRGLSAVVTTVIMVLLVMVAVGIVWVVVKNLITDSTSQISGDFKMDLEILTITKGTSTGDGLDVQIRRNVGEGNLEQATFLFSNATASKTQVMDITIKELEFVTLAFASSDVGISKVLEIAVYPMAKLDNGEFKLYEVPTDKTTGTWNN